MTELLPDTELTLTQRQYAETALSSAETLLAIFNDTLDFSKIEAGQLQLEEINFNLTGLIDQLTVMFLDRAHSKNIEPSCVTSTLLFQAKSGVIPAVCARFSLTC